MNEASKTNRIRPADFAATYLKGRVLDIGAGDDLVCPWAQGFDVEDGDANHLDRHFTAGSFDTLHSSHSLEHMNNPVHAIEGWWSLVKPGGFLVVVVPDEDLYEQGLWPSFFSDEHKSTFRLNKRDSWSPVSHDLKALCQSLPHANVLSIERQMQGYDERLLFKPGLRPRKIRGALKMILSVIKRTPWVGVRWKDLCLRHLVRHGYPYDQTQGDALAQIQIIVQKKVH
jgi:SAM-dependent methyltransferase